MADLYAEKTLPVEARRQALQRWLTSAPRNLRLIAEDVRAEASLIDFVGSDPSGTPIAVVLGALAGQESEPPALTLARGISGASWLEAHLPDWLKIQPALPITPGAPARVWVLCGEIDPATQAAATALGPHVALGRVRELGSAENEGLWVEWLSGDTLAEPSPSDTNPASREPSRRSVASPTFEAAERSRATEPRSTEAQVPLRSGISLDEFGLSPEEQAEFDEPR